MYAHNYMECSQKVFRYAHYRAVSLDEMIYVDIFLICAV